MSTILFHKIVFGPIKSRRLGNSLGINLLIKSRRLGNSLGINLLPDNGKLCSFDCIYCECGWNKDGRTDQTIPSKEAVFQRMQERFAELHTEGTPVDTITFSGNGEPTLHPDFPEIIDFTLMMRDKRLHTDDAGQVFSERRRIRTFKCDHDRQERNPGGSDESDQPHPKD